MVFGALSRIAKSKFNRYSGKSDFLEAVAAACAKIASADGNISQEEEDTAILVAQENEALSSAFRASEIEEEFRKQFARTRTESGQKRIDRELEDVSNGPIEMREDVYAAALDVAKADGEVGPKERDALLKVAKLVRTEFYI